MRKKRQDLREWETPTLCTWTSVRLVEDTRLSRMGGESRNRMRCIYALAENVMSLLEREDGTRLACISLAASSRARTAVQHIPTDVLFQSMWWRGLLLL